MADPEKDGAAHDGAAGAGAPSVELVVWVAQLSLGFLLSSFGPSLILLARDLSTPREALAWVSAGFGGGLLLLGFTGERLLVIGPWRLFRGSAVGLAAGAALLGAAPLLRLAQSGALLLGLGGAGIVLATPLLLAGTGAAERMARAVGLSSLSGIGAPLLISATDAATGHGRLALLAAVPGLVWVALRPARMAPASPAPHEHHARSARGAGLRAARWWLAIVCAVSPEFAFVVWGAARLQDSGLGPAAASAAAAAFPLGMTAGRLLTPRLLARVPLVAWGVALAALGAAAAAAPLGPVLIAAASGLAGLGLAPLYPMLIDQLVRTPGLDPRRGASVGALGSGTAVLFAPMLLNLLAEVVTLRLGFLAALPPLALVVVLYRRGTRSPGAAPGR